MSSVPESPCLVPFDGSLDLHDPRADDEAPARFQLLRDQLESA